MSGIKYYQLAKGEEMPDEFCVVRDVDGEPSEYLFYVPETENAKLRELVVLWSVINKHMSLCATTDCEQCPVREECGESVHLEGLLGIDSKELSWRVQERMAEATDVQDESAKLRELIRDIDEVADPYLWEFIGRRKKALGIEVDE